MLRAVLVDVGGTVWPDRLTGQRADDGCLARLARLLPSLDPAESLATLRAALRADDQGLAQNTHAVLGRAIQGLGAECAESDLIEIRRALCEPASPGLSLFPGAYELFEAIRHLVFAAGLLEAGCPAAACVMVGDSEIKDIQPAVALGMRAIRVVIEEPPPPASAADTMVTSLTQARAILAEWVAPTAN